MTNYGLVTLKAENQKFITNIYKNYTKHLVPLDPVA